MNEVADATRDLIAALKTERDDLKVQVHLASMQIKDEFREDWQAAEHAWGQLKAESRRIGRKASAAADKLDHLPEVLDAKADAAMDELKGIYSRIRTRLGS